MKPYYWMTDFTPQEEWIDQQGLFLLLAFFFTEIGAGLYGVSLFLGFWRGCLAGWLISCVLGGGFHLLYLGKPLRAWRAVLKPRTSELSRGMVFMILFAGIGAIHIAPSLSFLGFLPWQSDILLFKIVMAVLCFFVITHGFMIMNVITGIPFWNSAILPVLALASGVWLGTQLGTAVSFSLSEGEILTSMEPVARWFLFVYIFLSLFFLWNSAHSSSAAQASVGVLVKGDLAPLFYGGVVLIGFVVPLVITFYFWANSSVLPSYGLASVRVICAFLGDLTLRYTISKSGRYAPLIYSNLVQG